MGANKLFFILLDLSLIHQMKLIPDIVKEANNLGLARARALGKHYYF